MHKKITLYALLLLALPITGFGQYSKLLDFGGSSYPEGYLISDGTYLYGMTVQGGTYGNIFKIKPDGTGYVDLYGFSPTPSNGLNPAGSFYYDGTYLYGMTAGGGGTICCTGGAGNIFKIMPDGTNYADLHNCGIASGYSPNGSLIYDGTYLYGMMPYGDTSTSCGTHGCGVIFKIKSDGTGYTTLLNFNGANGGVPAGDLIYDGTYLYGMTSKGGTNDSGLVFKIKPDGSGDTVLLNFAGVNGATPYGSLIYDGTYLYGMTYAGGANHLGTIFKIMPNGTGYVKLLDFAGTTNGTHPHGSLVSGGTYLYGMTYQGGTGTCPSGCGTIFKIMLDGTGYDTLHIFRGADGSAPAGSLLLNGGCLYGMTEYGGTNSGGTVFKYCLAGTGVQQFGIMNDEIRVYPNPTNNVLNVECLMMNETAIVTITDMLGNNLKQVQFNKQYLILNVEDLSAGVYFISVETEKGKSVKKIVKN